MMRLSVYRYGGPPEPIGHLVIDGKRLSVTTSDGQLARLVSQVNAAGYVHKWESIQEPGMIGDRILPLPIAETDEFVGWLERELSAYGLTKMGVDS